MTRVTKQLWLTALLMLAPVMVEAQAPTTGRIIGRVLDAGTARPMSGAQVFVGEGAIGTLTDLNGRYVLADVPVGLVDVTVQMIGYGTKTITDVEVVAGQVASLDITVEERALEVEGIVVTSAREEGSQAFLLDQRRTSTALLEGVGSTEISRRPDSDAADVAQRMTGVTVSEGKYVFVRGLGERYSQTTLNGSSLPSPEPEREVVPLDIFPSGFLESLQTQKSYTPDLPADFSGGSVKIETKDFPNAFTVRLGVGTSVNTESQFKDGFLDYPGGSRDFIGFDDGSREQPEVVRQIMGDVNSGQRLPTNAQQVVQIGQAFQGLGMGFTPTPASTPLNRSFNLSVGGRNGIFDDGELGYFVAGTYSDTYTRRQNDVERKWRVSSFDPAVPAESRQPNVEYAFSRGSRDVVWGTIGNFTFKPNREQKISLRTTVNVSSEDEARRYQGDNREDIGGTVRSDRLRFVSRLMLWGQLSGEHQLFANSRLDWRATAARASRDEPMLREAVYLADTPDAPFYLHPIGESGRYFWSELVDDDMSGALDWSFPFDAFGGVANLKFGGEYRQRTRDFAARRLNWNFIGGDITDFEAALAAGTVVSTVRNTGEFAMQDVVEPGDLYDVEDRRAAGYALLDVPMGPLQAIVGARVEQYALDLGSRGDTLQSLQKTDVAPSLSLIYSLSDQLKLRGAVSRTLDRPEFRELAPFQFTEATSLRQLFGNPELEPARVVSGDLRLDWFPSPGEMFSVGGYYKHLTDPIEQVFIAAASSAYSFQNAEKADIVGIELDAQVGLGRLADALEAFSFQGNYSWIDSDVTVRAYSTFQPTNLSRPLEGQAPYVLNVGLNWANPAGVEAGLFLNRFGQRLSAAGGSGIPDLYEMPRNALDATLGFPLAGGASARIRATNLLDAEYRFEQEANGITQIQRLYSVGRTISVGLSWEF